MYQDIVSIVKKEWEVISNVFPHPAEVLQIFLQRFFAQSVRLLYSLLYEICSYKFYKKIDTKPN